MTERALVEIGQGEAGRHMSGLTLMLSSKRMILKVHVAS